jgi:hypothetical protein
VQISETRKEATFRCRICNLDLPASEKAQPWKKGKQLIDLGRCRSCDRVAAQWNTTLKNDGNAVQPDTLPRPRRRRRR